MKIQQSVRHACNVARKSFVWSGVATTGEAFFPAIVGVVSCILGAPHYGLWTGFLVIVKLFWICFYTAGKFVKAFPD